jgi:glyoxylase-like metal-dependent hydrolase (beta-lactamase superfamily II)
MRASFIIGIILAPLLASSAYAQVAMAGEWLPIRHEDIAERGPGPDLGDYLGLPINDAARLRAESWDASRLTLQEHQCAVHMVSYIYRGPLSLRIWEEKDPDTQKVIAIKHYISTYEQTRTIWMDGRPHPPDYAPHTWMGFSTGKWEGDMLTVTTTHIKMDWIRRNGVAGSDMETLVEHFIRHGDHMTHVSIVTDPVYLTEPLIKTDDFILNVNNQDINWLWPCEYVLEVANRPKGQVPHYLPGENPFLHEFIDRTKVPAAAAAGGAESTYPEYRANMRKLSAPSEQGNQPRRPVGKVEVYPVQEGVYLLVGAGGNVTVQTGSQGVAIVDSGAGEVTRDLLAAVHKLSDKPIKYLINTSVNRDHAGGNEAMAKVDGAAANLPIVNTPGSTAIATMKIIAHESVLDRMSAPTGSKSPWPVGAWPSDTYSNDEREIYYNGEAVLIRHVPHAHTDGDSIVHFRRSDVISAGEIYVTDSYPVIDLEKGGTLEGIIDGLNLILDIAVPGHQEEGGTMIVPGHGRISDEADVVEYRDMLTIFRDRIQAMMKKGMTIEQIQAARPTLDYDPEFGHSTGPWTTRMFVEAAYKSLSK